MLLFGVVHHFKQKTDSKADTTMAQQTKMNDFFAPKRASSEEKEAQGDNQRQKVDHDAKMEGMTVLS